MSAICLNILISFDFIYYFEPQTVKNVQSGVEGRVLEPSGGQKQEQQPLKKKKRKSVRNVAQKKSKVVKCDHTKMCAIGLYLDLCRHSQKFPPFRLYSHLIIFYTSISLAGMALGIPRFQS